MKKENGITLVTLVIGIIILLILASIATTAGLDSIRTAKKTSMITELEMIQEKVNTIYEKRKLNQNDVTYYNSLGQDISVVNSNIITQILGQIPKEGYRYFSAENLKQLDLDNISQDVIINFDTRDVLSMTGITVNDTIYYRLTDMPDYQGQNIQYVDKNNQSPTFDVEVNKLSNSWQITIKNITYNSNVVDGILSYKLHDNKNWIIVGEKNYFEVSKSGLYDVKLTDRAGNQTIKTILFGEEKYKEDFEEFTYEVSGTKINSCKDSILDVTSTNTNPFVSMYGITSLNPKQCRYIEIKYKTEDNTSLEFFTVEDPKDQEYSITNNELVNDGNWHTLVIDLWNNEKIKAQEEITGWRFDWGENKMGVSMQIDYIRVI